MAMDKENEITGPRNTELWSLFFNIKDHFEVPDEEFDNILWPLVTNIWTLFDLYKFKNGDFWKVYVCRFIKHRNSSTRQEDVPIEKRRKTNIQPSGLCEAKIKITWSASSKIVRIERFKDSPDHAHTLGKSTWLNV